jgi:pimeloyl-ACP methyl ester carboxylesterase
MDLKPKNKTKRKMKIYCVPGLANDKRVFDNLCPLLISQDITFLEHIAPAHPTESMKDYARRLIAGITDFEENSVIIGMSLGGIISVEISKILPMKKVFLISTIKHPNEFPWQIKMLKNLPLERVQIPAWLIRKSLKPVAWLLGVTDSTGRDHIQSMIDAASEDHIAWAQYAAANWDNRLIPNNYIHIHGTKDEIFPAAYVKASHFIEGGNHYMIMERAKEVAQIINAELEKIMPANKVQSLKMR